MFHRAGRPSLHPHPPWHQTHTRPPGWYGTGCTADQEPSPYLAPQLNLRAADTTFISCTFTYTLTVYTASLCDSTSEYDPESTGIWNEDLYIEKKETQHVSCNLPQHGQWRAPSPYRIKSAINHVSCCRPIECKDQFSEIKTLKGRRFCEGSLTRVFFQTSKTVFWDVVFLNIYLVSAHNVHFSVNHYCNFPHR